MREDGNSSDPCLVLSAYVLPEIRQGVHLLMPQNLSPGAARIDYARRVITQIEQMVAAGAVDVARRYREGVLFGSYLTTLVDDPVTGAVKVEALPDLEQALGLDVDALGVLLRDGRLRDGSAMSYLPTGAATANLVDLLWRLHRGISRSELLARAEEHDFGFDAELLDDLIARGVVEVGSARQVDAPVAPAVT